MQIIEKNDDCFKKSADNKRLNAKNTIANCIEKSIGIYEIVDDENIFTNNTQMFQYLKMYTRPAFFKQSNFKIEIKSKEKYKHIFAIIKKKGE